MSDTTPTRRDVLRTAATATAVTGLGAAAGSARSGRSAQVLEAGLRYDVPGDETLRRVQADSRPPYTIDRTAEALFVGLDAGPNGNLADRIAEAGALIAERPTVPGQSRGIGPAEKTETLPIGLTSRMRPRGGLSLVEPTTPPRVKLNRNGRHAKLQITGGPTRKIDPASEHTVRLEPTTVTAQTATVVDSPVTDPDIPEHMRADQQVEFGTKTVDVTPVAEVVHHGEVSIVDRRIA